MYPPNTEHLSELVEKPRQGRTLNTLLLLANEKLQVTISLTALAAASFQGQNTLMAALKELDTLEIISRHRDFGSPVQYTINTEVSSNGDGDE
jgi:hypothetical protein